MTPERTLATCYSPTGTTAAAVRAVSSALAEKPEAVDLTRRAVVANLAPEDVAVLGCPVHEGRLPREAGQRFSEVRGTFTPAVLLVTYGGRTFGTALEELEELARSQGFLPFAGVAMAGGHSQLTAAPCAGPVTLGGGQEGLLGGFAREAAAALHGAASVFDLPHWQPPRDAELADHPEKAVKAACDADECIGCGACPAACPRQCIPEEEPYKTDRRRCNGCGACVRTCPVGARELGPESALGALRG